MATIRSYSATFEHTTVANAALTRWRFNEDAGATIALDSVDALDGSYEAGAAPGDDGSIGDGAARFDGLTGRVLVADTLTGTLRLATLGDSLATGQVAGSGGFQTAGNTFADKLPAALEGRGLTVQYFDHAVPGDKTADGLQRVDDVLDDTPAVVIVELGTNDALNEIDPGTVEINLRAIISDLQEGGVDQILLAGAFGFYPDRPAGRLDGYDNAADRNALEGLYAEIAGDTDGVELLQDASGSEQFLGGFRDAGDPADLDDDTIVGGVLASDDQSLVVAPSDGLHPNAAGIDFIVERVVPQNVELGAAAGVVNDVLATANGSIELWFTPDSVTGTQMLFSKAVSGVPSLGDIEILLDGDEVAVGMQNASSTFAARGGTVAVGEATHVVFKFGANGMELYVDGVLEASNPFTGGLTGNLEELGIGARADGTLAFDGVIDEVAVYDRALTVGEIQQLFVGGGLGTSVLGTANADTIFGGSDDEDLRGAFGADTILARGGNDALRGGAGPDDLRGGPGDDRLFGGSGADAMSGAAGADRLLGHGGKDDLSGGAGEDLLDGDGGRDSLAGGADADRLFGGPAVDHLSGGAGDDLLNGGPGRDSLLGGADADTFRIDRLSDGIDRVRDFAPGEGDVLDLSAVLDFTGGDDANDFVQLNDVSGHTNVDVDPNGAGGDFTTVFRLIGTTGLNLDTLVAAGNVQLEPPTS